jgi:hypothetical protein
MGLGVVEMASMICGGDVVVLSKGGFGEEVY